MASSLTRTIIVICLMSLTVMTGSFPSQVAAQGCIGGFDYQDYHHWVGILPGLDTGRPLCVAGDVLYVARETAALILVDIANPLQPSILQTVTLDDQITTGRLEGHLLYLLLESDVVQIVDLTVPASPLMRGSVIPTIAAYDIQPIGDCLIIGGGDYLPGGIEYWDIDNPDLPTLIGGISTTRAVVSLARHGDFIYTAEGVGGLESFYFADPGCPQLIGSYSDDLNAQLIRIDGDRAYVVDGTGGLVILDVANPSLPLALGSLPVSRGVRDIALSGDHAFLTTRMGELRIVDFTDPTNPLLTGGQVLPAVPQSVVIAGNHLFVIVRSMGLLVYSTGDTTMEFAPGVVGGVDVGSDYNTTLAISGDFAYLLNTGGMHIIDISDPALPTLSQTLVIEGEVIRGGGDHLYLINDTGLQSYDISTPGSPFLLDELTTMGNPQDLILRGTQAFVVGQTWLEIIDISIPGVLFSMATLDLETSWSGSGHIGLNGDLALVGGYGDLHVINISQLLNPVELGHISSPPDSINAIAGSGSLALLGAGDTGVHFYDVSDPTAPTWINNIPVGSYITTPIIVDEIMGNSLVYFSYIFGNFNIYDFSNPLQARWLGSLPLGGEAWDAVLDGDYIYVATSRGYEDAGLQIFRRQCDATPVAVSLFTLELSAGSVIADWQTESDFTADDFKLVVTGVGAEREVVITRSRPGHFRAVDSDDELSAGGRFTYTLYQHDLEGGWLRARSESVLIGFQAVGRHRLDYVQPNPFNPMTRIAFNVGYQDRIRLSVYDVSGREVALLAEGEYPRGEFEIFWDGRNARGRQLPSGVYFLQLRTEEFNESRKLTILR